jgi:hypothetical protein
MIPTDPAIRYAMNETATSSEIMSMQDQPQEVQIEYRIDLIVRELDELCAIASRPETVHLIEKQRSGVGQICVRANLIASFLLARNPGQLKMVRNRA